MTKADLIDAVVRRTAMTKRAANQVIELIFDEVQNALKNGERVVLNPFGSFVVRPRKAREGRNPKTGQKIAIPARNVAAFVAGRALRDAVDGRSRKKVAHR